MTRINVQILKYEYIILYGIIFFFVRGIGRGRGVPLSRPLMVNAYHPGQFQHLGEIDVDEDDDEDMGYYSHHVPGIYEDTNR